MMRKYILTLLYLFLTVVVIHAQEAQSGGDNTASKRNKLPKHNLLSWNTSERLGTLWSSPIDTIPTNFQYTSITDGYRSLYSHLAQYGSALQARDFFEQPDYSGFLFSRSFLPYMKQIENIDYFRTTIPYTNISYNTAGSTSNEEQMFKVLFTANAGKKFNFGGDINFQYIRGFYSNQATNSLIFSFWTSYITDRYQIHATYFNNNLSTMENGGITNDQYITNPLEISGGKSVEAKDIPINLTNAYNRIKDQTAFITHKYNIGFEKYIIDSKDSTMKDSILHFVPVSSIFHSLRYTFNDKSFVMKNAPVNKSFFNNYYFNESASHDTTAYHLVQNTLGISLNEGFNKFAAFGVSAFAEHRFEQYNLMNEAYYLNPDPEISNLITTNLNSVLVGASILREKGKKFNFQVTGTIGAVGYRAGEININGEVRTRFSLPRNETLSLSAYAYFRNEKPNFLLNRYVSNHFIWNNDFTFEQRLRVGGIVRFDKLGLYARGGVETMQNHLFFNEKALPEQSSENVQIVSVSAGKDFQFGPFNLENEFNLQFSSNGRIVPVPLLSIYANLYFKFTIARVLHTQIGIDCRYFTQYKAPAYQPAINSYYNQQEVMIGNYPVMNVYANFKLKQARFFVMYYHANQSIFPAPNYFSSPNNPINPAVLKLGVSWYFLN